MWRLITQTDALSNKPYVNKFKWYSDDIYTGEIVIYEEQNDISLVTKNEPESTNQAPTWQLLWNIPLGGHLKWAISPKGTSL